MGRTVSGADRATVAAHGLRVTLPPRWEARLYLRDRDEAAATAVLPLNLHPDAFGHPDESMNPVLHLANFALPPGRGDFGTGAVERMGPAHVFVSLVEYDAEEAGRPLFAARGLPRPRVQDFASNALQRRLPGQLGNQHFFTDHDRAFCLYTVLGSRQHAGALVTQVHDVLDRVGIHKREVQPWARPSLSV
ncbi:hypothetical protein [uncultured Jatrophihabitans sp.]|uniref:hypothetical protein n=1 Tax=uncultured Jatrophihabitans sp. TaxID=1610747 RepID=UPI0035CB0023